MDKEEIAKKIFDLIPSIDNPNVEEYIEVINNIADWHLSEIAKAKTSLLREIIKTIDANNLEGIDRDWFVFKLKCLEENKGDE